MLKLCLFRGCRILLMLAVIFVVSISAVFIISPDAGFLKGYITSQIQESLSADKVDIEDVKLSWNLGPVVELGQTHIESPQLSIYQSNVSLTYRAFDVLLGRLSPAIFLQGGELFVNVGGKKAPTSDSASLSVKLDDVKVTWELKQERQTFEHVYAFISSNADDVSFKADGISFYLSMRDNQTPQFIRLNATNFSGFPVSWKAYVQGLDELSLDSAYQGNETWSWNVALQAKQGLVHVKDIHLKVPFESVDVAGVIQLSSAVKGELLSFETKKMHWKDGANFGDFKLSWEDGLLHLDALDASTTMPMLWSWLWMLGDEPWHEWLSSMHQGRLEDVRGTLDLIWPKPLETPPTYKDLIDMKYHVVTNAYDADIALGLGNDYLYHTNAKVEVDEKHLQAWIGSTDLNAGVGKVSGDYNIRWDTLIMDVEAKGLVDVGKLHKWLSPESAAKLGWLDSKAQAEVSMRWDATKDVPERTVVHFQPSSKGWKLAPMGMDLSVSDGEAIWDFNQGLDLRGMQVNTPWLAGELSLFIDKNNAWNLDALQLDGVANLALLKDEFSLPIMQPEGDAKLSIRYGQRKWSGNLDFSACNWESFAGFTKAKNNSFNIPFSGLQTTEKLLPVRINHLESKHDEFTFYSDILIDENKLDLQFKGVNTAAIRGDIRVLIPFEKSLAWGVEVDVDYVNKTLLSQYVSKENIKVGESSGQRPWSIFLDAKELEWDRDTAKNIHMQFSSDKQSSGSFSASLVTLGDAKLEHVKSTFTLLEQGKIDLHNFEADGSGQHIIISGAVQPEGDGILAWQGIAFMNGKFGTLMKQAELDKLFKEGEMSSLFLGKGKFKQGEPWWRELKGSLRLRVDDGRIIEGGTLTHLLAAMSLVDLPKYLIFQRSDVVGEGLLYDKLQIEADFDSNILGIKQLGFKSSALDAGGVGKIDLESGEMDILLIARPWQNIEAIIGSIPILGEILAGEDKSILRKVYRIHGPASDAAVDEVNAEDVGLPKAGYLEDLFTPSRWLEPREKVKEKVK